MDINSIVGKNIKNVRLKFGYTQSFVAEYLNMTAAAVNQYENDARNVPANVLEKLALLYGVEEYDFYEEDIEKQTLVSSFAFRAGEISASDMQSVSKFRKIISNYISMSTALKDA